MDVNYLELFAVLLGITSVWFARKENISVYPFGIANVLIYIYICFASRLYANAGINVVYLVSNIYGWYRWSRKTEDGGRLKITKNSVCQNVLWLLAAVFFYVIIVRILLVSNAGDVQYTDSALPWVDALNSSFFLCATILMTIKKVENWLFWIGGNIISIPIYFSQGLYFTAFQYTVFLVLAILGWTEWRAKLNAGAKVESTGCAEL